MLVCTFIMLCSGRRGPQFRTAALRSNRQCGAAALRTRVPLRPLPAIVQKTGLLVQLDQTGQVLVTIVCNLLVACEQSLCTLGECTGQAAVTGLVCQQCLILLGIHSLGGQGEGFLPCALLAGLKVNRFQ